MTAVTDKSNLFKYLFITAIAVIAVAIAFVHVWKIDVLPSGLYVDEASIGQNAAAIKSNLQDQHGQFLPIYFEALDDYKNPVYIYTTAFVFQILGVSDLSLRLTSTVFFLVTIAGTILLVKKIFPKHPITLVYSLIVISTLPWFFTFSRISFDTIAQPAIFVWALYFIYSAYQQVSTKATIYYSLAAGLLTGLAFYTSSTSKFLSITLILTILVVYRSQEYWKRHVFLLSSFIASLIPYLYFIISNPGIQQKVGFISYFYANDLSLWQKIQILLVNYLSYFDPFFLLVTGDPNLRHHTGSMGQLYVATAILALLGLCFVVVLRNSNHKYFGWLIVACGLTAPLAAAITDQSHAQLSIMFGFYIAILSVFGIAALEFLPNKKIKLSTISALSILLIIQLSLYLNNYFTSYPSQTVDAFESYNFNLSMDQAIAQQPDRIVVSDQSNGAASHLGFYQTKDDHRPLQGIEAAVEVPLANSDTCIIAFKNSPAIDNQNQLKATYNQANDFTTVTCF